MVQVANMELSVEQALQKGIELHKAGRVKDAAQYYTAILKVQPDNPHANHNMGVLAVGLGKEEQALTYFNTALESKPDVAQFWISYVDVLIKLKRFVDAKSVLDKAQKRGAKGSGFDALALRLQEGERKLAADDDDCDAIIDERKRGHTSLVTSLKLDQALKLAKQRVAEGASAEARQIYEEILIRWPKNKKAQAALYRLSDMTDVAGVPNQDPPQHRIQILASFHQNGNYKRLIAELKELLEQFPNSSVLYNMMGAAYQGLNEPGPALDAYNKAININPNYAAAHSNIGMILQRQGKIDDAIVAYEKSVSVNPNYYQAYNNLGILLKKKGRNDEAIAAYTLAINAKPDYADAYNNIGNVFQDQGKLAEAIGSYVKSIDLNPDNLNAYNNLGIILRGITFKQPWPELQKIIYSLLDKKSLVRPASVARAAISLLKYELDIENSLKNPPNLHDVNELVDVIERFADFPLFLKLMRLCPLPDIEIEKLLKNVRSELLFFIDDVPETDKVLKFQSALALQCFVNEYVYASSKDEDIAVAKLEKKIKYIIEKGEQPAAKYILCLASFRALFNYTWCDGFKVGGAVKNVYIRQVEEPNEEFRIRATLPRLTDVKDNTSAEVRKQYEEYPYPRWVRLRCRAKPAPLSVLVEEMDLRLTNEKISKVESPSILIAGCGTGQHSIETSQRFQNCNVLAVDLSLSSLSYAKRKTDELCISNISYMQADILDLDEIEDLFDIVESVGVLHHMHDPFLGWKKLANRLKPGGLMKIGLYSDLARRDVFKTRKDIKKLNVGASFSEMKSFREMMMASRVSHYETIMATDDFYSLSTVKDLIFHVQEHVFTIPMIQNCLKDLNLKFCGFEGQKILSRFKIHNPKQDAKYDLDEWHVFEKDNPSTFAGMYQFWCQKI